jgi:hypothetical protein
VESLLDLKAPQRRIKILMDISQGFLEKTPELLQESPAMGQDAWTALRPKVKEIVQEHLDRLKRILTPGAPEGPGAGAPAKNVG